MAKDVVCGMPVEDTRTPTSSYGGRTFYFCSPSCKTVFDQSPGEYEKLADSIPPPLARLPELARNLRWSWHSEAAALFDTVGQTSSAPALHNPIQVLLDLDRQTLDTYAQDRAFLARYQQVLAAFDSDLTTRPRWGQSQRMSAAEPLAYFSAEFGVHSALPVYSGGLGVLAGDMAKEANDLGVPLVGVGFMYPQGYFRQRVTSDGRQQEVYERLRFSLAPAAGGERDERPEGGHQWGAESQRPGRLVGGSLGRHQRLGGGRRAGGCR